MFLLKPKRDSSDDATRRALSRLLAILSKFIDQYNRQIAEPADCILIEEHKAQNRTLVSNAHCILSFCIEKDWVKSHLFKSTDLLKSARPETQFNLKLALHVVASPPSEKLMLDDEELTDEQMGALVLSLFEEFVRRSNSISQNQSLPRVDINGQSIARIVRKLINERNNAISELLTQNEKIHNQMARELHDEVISELLMLKQVLSSDGVSDEKLDIVDDAVNALRDVCSGLSSRELQDWGLLPSLKNFVQKTRRKTDIAVNLRAVENMIELPFEISLQIFRIAQEAINNAIKHSGAGKIDVEISEVESVVCLRVSDNGVAPVQYVREGGMGNHILNERAALIAELMPAELKVFANGNGGTTLELRVFLVPDAVSRE